MTTKFILEPPSPKLYYTPEAWADMWFIINESPLEVGWMCFTEKQGHDFLVTSVFVPEQKVSGAETDINETAMSKYAMDLLDAGARGSVLGWGHSHVNMGTSPSGQDNTQLKEFLKDPDVPYFIRSIYNKRGDSNTVIYEPHLNVWHADVHSAVYMEGMSAERQAELKEILKTNVKEKTYPAYNNGYRNNFPYNGNRNFNQGSNQHQNRNHPTIVDKKNLGSNSEDLRQSGLLHRDGTPIDLYDDDDWFDNPDLWPNIGLS